MDKTPRAGEIFYLTKDNPYQIITMGIHKETCENMVIYQALFGDYGTYVLPLSKFMDEIKGKAEKTLFNEKEETDKSLSNEIEENDKTIFNDKEEADESQGEINSILLSFLEADSYSSKLEVITSNMKAIDDKLINNMAASLDCTVDDGPIDQRLHGLMYCLKQLSRFEIRRWNPSNEYNKVGKNMSHYFIEDKNLKEDRKKIEYNFKDNKFVFTTDAGVFSKDHIDPATDILLNTIPPLSGTLLDMGCGYGCIGIVLAKTYSLQLTQADINQLALDLTKKNCIDNGLNSNILKSNCFDNISSSFDTIVINPPIHAGKAITYKMYEDSYSHLNNGGKLYIVTLKKHGAETTKAKLNSIFGNCETLYKKKGHYVFCCTKTL